MIMEKTVVRKLLVFLNGLNSSHFFKTHGGSFSGSGVSDLVGTIKGRSVYIECKDVGKEKNVSELQQKFLNKMESVGAVCIVSSSVDHVREVLTAYGLIE